MIPAEHQVGFLDAFVDKLDLAKLQFNVKPLNKEGRPPFFHPLLAFRRWSCLKLTFCSYKFVAAFEAEMCRLALALSTKLTLASSHFTRHDL